MQTNAQDVGLATGTGNNPQAYNSQDYNSFDRSQLFAQTQRFAEISPVFAKKFIADDRIPIFPKHQLRTYTLNSPLLSKVYMNKGHFLVPLQAIYHNTFLPVFKNPVKGSDISDNFKPLFPLSRFRGGSSSIYNFLYNNKAKVKSATSDDGSVRYLNTLFFTMQFFDRDGLLQKLGYSFKTDFTDRMYDFFYKIFNGDYSVVMTILFQDDEHTFNLSIDGQSLTIDASQTISLTGNIEQFRQIIYDLIQNKYEITSFFSDIFEGSGDVNAIQHFDDALAVIPIYSTDDFLNIEKVIAYQYVCAQFYTNSFVDDIYNARLWEMNILSIYKNIIKNSVSTTYRGFSISENLNGVEYEFDLISYNTILNLLKMTTSYGAQGTYPDGDSIKAVLCLRNVFEIQNSLRTSDYFLDSRTQPLAIGDVYSQVTAQGVSAIDINKSLWRQRLLNAINRIPQDARHFIKDIFGVEPESKEPQPNFIAKQRFLIGKQEVENTSSFGQGNVVTNLRSDEGNVYFETKATEPCIVISLVSYSLEYCYQYAMDKEFVEFEREDNFNPYLQHFGDQPLLRRELDNDPSRPLNEVFAYQQRYYQYKKSSNHVSGGFVTSLPSWLAIYEKNIRYDNVTKVLSSKFIRNHNSDFDKFYSSLSGFAPTDYYHFICLFDTECNVLSRQQKTQSLL